MSDYQRLAALALTIEKVELRALAHETASGWTRKTTLVVLQGQGEEGIGEDITYSSQEQEAFQARALPRLAGQWSLTSFSHELDRHEFFDTPPEQSVSPLYRRWAFESAALDLALRQAGTNLSEVLDRPLRPVHYVVSTGLGTPPSTKRLEELLQRFPDLKFKLDFASDWNTGLLENLAGLNRVRVVDYKGLYREGSFRGPEPDPTLYRQVAESLDCLLEDPALNEATSAALQPYRNRVAWDFNLHSLADLLQLPWTPKQVNIKPSRFGCLSELFRVYAYCEARGISMYGGGQFELGPGRHQLQLLASLFHPNAPNDVAPSGFNQASLPEDIPMSPLVLPLDYRGFRPEPSW